MSGDGVRYEQFCCRYLQDRGFKTSTTPASGDQGVDIIAIKDDVRYAIQCKYRTDSDVGNDAIQQVSAGKGFYECDIAVVMTNSGFTPKAKELARKLRVRLWENIHLSKDTTEPRVANERGDGVNSIIIEDERKPKVSNVCVNEVTTSSEGINKISSAIHSYKWELDCIQSELTEENELQPLSINVESPYSDDELESILRALEKCELSALLKRALSCGGENRYYFQSFGIYDDVVKLYELQKELLEQEMIVERVSSNLFVVIASEDGFLSGYALEKEVLYKWKSMVIGRNIQDTLSNIQVDAKYLFSAKTKDEEINEHIFFINGQLPSEDDVETTLIQLYSRRIRVFISGRYLRVFVSDVVRLNEKFAYDEFTQVKENSIFSMDGKIYAFTDTGIDKQLTDVRIVLETVSVDDLFDVDFFTFKNPSNAPIWKNIVRYLHIVFEQILYRSILYHNSSEEFLYYRSRILDCSGNVMFILNYGIVNRRFDYLYEAGNCYDLFLINDMFGWDHEFGLGPFRLKSWSDASGLMGAEEMDKLFDRTFELEEDYDEMLLEKDDYIKSLFDRFNNTNNKPPVKLSYGNDNGKVTINYSVPDGANN